MDRYGDMRDQFFSLDVAKEECSKSRRCLGIEPPLQSYDTRKTFAMCLDAIYISHASNKYGNLRTMVYKKIERHGEYMNHVLLL